MAIQMKRMVIVLTFVAASAPDAGAQEANSDLYGDFRYSYNYADAGDASHWASANNASRLGVRGRVSGSGTTAFFDLQTGVNIDAEGSGGAFTQRYYFAGVRGGFGTVTVGRQSTAYKMAGLRLDPFYDSSTLSAGGGVPSTGLFAGASFGLSNLTNGFADRTVAYTSPSVGGVTVNAAAYIDTDSDHDYGLGVGYLGHGVDAGLQYYNADEGRTWTQAFGIRHALRVHAAYTRAETWSIGASYERVTSVAEGAQDFLFVAGTLNVTPRILVAGAVGHVSSVGTVQGAAGMGYHVGAFYSLFQQVRFHALYSHRDADAGPSAGNAALGLSYHFAIQP